MADYVINMSGTAAVDDSIVEEFNQQVLITHGEMGTADAFATLKADVGAKSVSMPIYNHLAIATAPLTEKEDLDSEALVDGEVVFIPAEYGKVVTKTSLASLQTGGVVDLAAARLVGINMAQSQNKLALLALDASANKIFPSTHTSIDDIVRANVLTGTMANKAYRKMARVSVPGLPQAQGHYIAIAHEDVCNDIRQETDFEDIKKYNLPGADELSKNIIGFYKGFLWVRDNFSTRLAANANAVPCPVYNTYFLGFNGLGKGTSLAPHLRITGPFDKLARFANIGWYGAFKYGIVQPESVVVCQSSASEVD